MLTHALLQRGLEALSSCHGFLACNCCVWSCTNAHKEQQLTQNIKQNDLYKGIENAVYILSKGAETCPNFKHTDLAYKSIENVGYISLSETLQRSETLRKFKHNDTRYKDIENMVCISCQKRLHVQRIETCSIFKNNDIAYRHRKYSVYISAETLTTS